MACSSPTGSGAAVGSGVVAAVSAADAAVVAESAAGAQADSASAAVRMREMRFFIFMRTRPFRQFESFAAAGTAAAGTVRADASIGPYGYHAVPCRAA